MAFRAFPRFAAAAGRTDVPAAGAQVATAPQQETPQQVGKDSGPVPFHVLALQNGYHGDTLATMDCAEASVFNLNQTPWYAPRGLFLEPPTVGLEQGRWTVRVPQSHLVQAAGSCAGKQQEDNGGYKSASFDDLTAMLDTSKRQMSELATQYQRSVEQALQRHEAGNGVLVGACIIEPVLQGAGGMVFVDPLFQRAICQVCF